MNILIINWQDIKNPYAGGAEVHLHEVFKRIAERGHRITLFCHAIQGLPKEETVDSMRVIRRGNRFLFNFIVPFYYLFVFRKQGYDVIVDDFNKIPFYTPLFVRRPIQGVTHHLFGKSIFIEAPFPLACYVAFSEFLIRFVYRNTPIILGSPSTYNEYHELGFDKNNLTLINYCVDHERYVFDPAVRVKKNCVGFIGRLKKYKSVDHLILAFTEILKEQPDMHLLIIGDGDDKPRLQSMCEDLKVVEKVTFTGFVSEEEKVRLTQEMNFVVNTSSKEGWGLTVVESNACGVPVIAANVQGLRDSVIDNETGMLYEYGNIPELVEKMKHLLANEQLRNSIRDNALAWAAKFDWRNAATQTLSVIEDTIVRYRARKDTR